MRTRITKAITLVAASAALLGGAALVSAAPASAAAPAHVTRPMAPRHHSPVRTERVWVKGHYVTVRAHGKIRREWIQGHYTLITVR